MLIETLKLITGIVNYIHDKLVLLTRIFDLRLTDKELHFWVIGLLGIFLFFIVQKLFKFIAQYSITVISFIYTFTVLVVVVFTIEIMQKLTGRGNMEFLDIVEGIRGFVIAFLIYLIIRLLIVGVKKIFKGS